MFDPDRCKALTRKLERIAAGKTSDVKQAHKVMKEAAGFVLETAVLLEPLRCLGDALFNAQNEVGFPKSNRIRVSSDAPTNVRPVWVPLSFVVQDREAGCKSC